MKNEILLFLLFGCIIFSQSSCKSDDRSHGQGGQMFANFWQGPEPFTNEELTILNETLNISNTLPDFDVNNLGHSNGTSRIVEPYTAMLGRVLFYDKVLSDDLSISCASCHQQSLAFADNQAFSDGVNGNQTLRNSIALGSFPSFISTYGAGAVNDTINQKLFWDERSSTIHNQLTATIQNPNEMGQLLYSLNLRLNDRPYYPILFKRLSKEGTITNARILTALATFLGSIHSQNSLLDQALIQMGTNSTIDQDLEMFNLSQELGRELFVENCMSCHGKSIFESADILFTSANNGLEEEYLDRGIGAITFDENDNGKFKIPSLRNIEMTAPYMHDGRFETLQEVIEFYNSGIQAHLNLNEELKDVDGNPKQFNFTEEEKIALIDFLKTMTDETLLIDSKYSDPFK